MAAAHGNVGQVHDGVALHHHHFRGQVADIHQHGGAVPFLVGHEQHRLAHRCGQAPVHRHMQAAEPFLNILQEEPVGDHEGDHAAQLVAAHTHGLQGLFPFIHDEPGRTAVNDAAADLAQLLHRFIEQAADILFRYPGISPLQIHLHFHRANSGKIARHTHINLFDVRMGLILGRFQRSRDRFVELIRSIPAPLHVSVIDHRSGAYDIAALPSAGFRDERHDLACTKLDGRNRGLHPSIIPCSSAKEAPSIWSEKSRKSNNPFRFTLL